MQLYSPITHPCPISQVTAKILEELDAKLGSEPTVSLISDTAEVFKAAIDGLDTERFDEILRGAQADGTFPWCAPTDYWQVFSWRRAEIIQYVEKE